MPIETERPASWDAQNPRGYGGFRGERWAGDLRHDARTNGARRQWSHALWLASALTGWPLYSFTFGTEHPGAVALTSGVERRVDRGLRNFIARLAAGAEMVGEWGSTTLLRERRRRRASVPGCRVGRK